MRGSPALAWVRPANSPSSFTNFFSIGSRISRAQKPARPSATKYSPLCHTRSYGQ